MTFKGSVRANWVEATAVAPKRPRMRNPFRYFNSSPEDIRLTVLLYIRFPLSLRQVEDILFERGFDINHETVRLPKPLRPESPGGDGMVVVSLIRQIAWRACPVSECSEPPRRVSTKHV
jgi:hypothetical protein